MDTDRTQLPLAATGSCACCSTDAGAGHARAAAPAGAETRTLLVEGMTCAHCVASVTEELGELDGVDGVTIELVAGGASTVTVTTRGPVPADALRSAVEEAGYEVVPR